MTKPKNTTESINTKSLHLDVMSSKEIVSLMAEEDKEIVNHIDPVLDKIAQAVEMVVEQWNKGGRVFVVGAGTSGRLGVLDAVELIPTFSIEPNRWIGLIAGGHEAMWEPLEEHEDSHQAVQLELNSHNLNETDIIIGVTASGSTPYVLSALSYGKDVGSKTISISCNDNTDSSHLADCGIEVVVGPEVIRGSTRLKAGTAQKMVLNMISTASMTRLGKVYQNQMVDLKLINKKLVQRAIQTIMDVTGLVENKAEALLEESNFQVKHAIFIHMTSSTLQDAELFLQKTDGRLKDAIELFHKEKWPIDKA